MSFPMAPPEIPPEMGLSDDGPLPPRKKFTLPPVKNACLACRASRIRCNGERPCASCKAKERDCEYKPSRRGGPRIRKKSRIYQGNQGEAAASIPKSEEVPQEPLVIENFINPGAGLKPLADMWTDSDTMYNQIFHDPVANAPALPKIPTVRTYQGNNRAILNAYYIWIHPYFPIFPAPLSTPSADEVIPLSEEQRDQLEEPSSAVSLAISAILALVPCPQDPHPLDPESVRWRRTYAQFLAKSAIELIESEHDIPESDTEPAKALDHVEEENSQERFHPQVPVQVESIIALDLLSIYEYAQRGNLRKMRDRAGTALMHAMSLHLHTRNDNEDGYAEARKRVWWMTYVCVTQGSIVGNTPATFDVFRHSFTAKYPIIRSDPEAWGIFIQSQQAILAATQFVIELNKARETGTNMNRIFDRMRELENFFEPLTTKFETWNLDQPVTQPTDPEERALSQSLRCIARIKTNSARIKVHRYCAFFDVAVFSGRHCDLKPAVSPNNDSQNIQPIRSCCSNIGSASSTAKLSPVSTTSTQKDDSSPGCQYHPHQPETLAFPFTADHSAQICLRAALNITEAFDLLPYPSPNGQVSPSPCYLGPMSSLIAPRTMPAFACCAMQSSYALLMMKDRVQAMYPRNNGTLVPGTETMYDRVQQGLLAMLLTLENYSSSFEALSGMRDQVREKVGFGNLAFSSFN